MKARRAGIGAIAATALFWPNQGQAYTEAQAMAGRRLFARCAQCHTVDSQHSGSLRMLAGPDALPVYPPQDPKYLYRFDTAVDIANLIQETMPRSSPGTLSREDSFALTAYVLQANDIPADGRLLDDQTGPEVVLDQVLANRQRRWLAPLAITVLVAGAIGVAALVLRRRRQGGILA